VGSARRGNQLDCVVAHEVKVDVLNQPYGGRPWIDMPMLADRNWYRLDSVFEAHPAGERRGARAGADQDQVQPLEPHISFDPLRLIGLLAVGAPCWAISSFR
jgi:hypothetical protein